MIRLATLADAGAITALWNHVITETTLTFTSTLKTLPEIEQIISDPARLVHVSEHNGAFAGFALISVFRGGTGYAHTVEHTIYLDETIRGRGLGAGLMRRLEKLSADAGHHVMVGAINNSNARAIAFHSAIGFERVGTMHQVGRKNDEWHDLALMQKIL